MIRPDGENHLGRKGLLLIIFRKTAPAFLLLLAAILLVALSGPIQQNAVGIGGSNDTPLPLSNISAYLGHIELSLLLLAIILLAVGFTIAVLVYNNYTFTFQEFDLRLRRGVLKIDEVSIPFRQMQAVNIERPIIYRLLGVSRVTINSAGQEEKEDEDEVDIILDPIDKEYAKDVQQLLQPKIGVQIVKDENPTS